MKLFSKPQHHLLFSAILLTLAMWLNTGTMAPYAVSTTSPFYTVDCQYPVNIDHIHFLAPHLMLKGAPPEYWSFSVVLRRILYSVISYPFIESFGFMAGGLLANLLMHLCTLMILFKFLKKEYSDNVAIAGAWLFASYPGIYYWTGLPYSYSMIVPGSVFAMIFLKKIESAQKLKSAFLFSLGIGITFLGYDLAGFFGLAAIFLCIYQRKFRWIIPVSVGLMLPYAISNLLLNEIYKVGLLNTNTAAYLNIWGAYKSLNFGKEWFDLFLHSPLILVIIYFTSNFYFLPAVFLILWLLFRKRLEPLGKAELAVLTAALVVFILNNWAPPYKGWQLRGEWIARLYQPVFPVFMIYIARNSKPAAIISIVLNLFVSLGSVLSLPITSLAWYHFYQHSTPMQTYQTIERLGKRPFGICHKKNPQ